MTPRGSDSGDREETVSTLETSRRPQSATGSTTCWPKRMSDPSVPNDTALDYKAYPLKSPTSIRLLHLNESKELDGPLTGSFDFTDLKAHSRERSFSALSYCWGSSDQEEVIFIDNHPLPITTQLRNALRRVRARGCRVLWADQICINQLDNAEKGQQVRLMENVYSCATRTYGYFGEATAVEELAAACLNYLTLNGMAAMGNAINLSLHGQREANSRIDSLLAAFLERTQQVPHAVQPACAATITTDELRLNVCRISLRPFLSRVWILQELIIAGPERLELLIGPQILGWGCAQALLSLLSFTDPAFRRKQIGTRVNLRLSTIDRLVSQGRDSGLRRRPLLDLLVECGSYFDSTDARDRLYALHALALGRSDMPAIDYSKSVRDVYIDHAWYFVAQHHPYLLVLPFLKGFVYIDEADIPTWCPGRAQMKEHMGSGIFIEANEQDQAYGPHATVMAKPDSEHGILEISGAIVDGIEEVPPLDEKMKLDRDGPLADPWLVENCEYLAAYFWPVCGGVEARAFDMAVTTLRMVLRNFFVRIMQRQLNKGTIGMTIYQSNMSKMKMPEGVPWLVELHETVWKPQLMQRLHDIYPGRRMTAFHDSLRISVTKRGFFVLSFRETSPGDAVAVLAGLRVPVILRPKGVKYQFLWRAQIEDLMQGEAFSRYGAELRPIKIC